MTNETEAPERIWAAECRATNSTMWWPDDAGGTGTEYTRADLSDAQAARIAELEERYRLVVGDKINLRGRVAELEAQLNEDDKLIDECERVIKGLRDHLEAAEAKLAKAKEERNRQKARAEYFENNANAWRDKWGAAHDRAEAAEAKLAKAKYRLHNISLNSSDAWAADEARVAIAELKGGE